MNEELIIKLKDIIKSLWITDSNNYELINSIKEGLLIGTYGIDYAIQISDLILLIDEVYLELNPIIIEETPILDDIIPE